MWEPQDLEQHYALLLWVGKWRLPQENKKWPLVPALEAMPVSADPFSCIDSWRYILAMQPRLTLNLTLLSQPPKFWDYRHVPPNASMTFFKKKAVTHIPLSLLLKAWQGSCMCSRSIFRSNSYENKIQCSPWLQLSASRLTQTLKGHKKKDRRRALVQETHLVGRKMRSNMGQRHVKIYSYKAVWGKE